MYHGKKTPYSKASIKKQKCVRCGNEAIHQWSICSNDNRYLPICVDCDILLNSIFLEFARLPNRKELIEEYKTNVYLY